MSIFDKYDLIDVDESFPIPQLPESGLVLLVGSSGSGKSTILRKWFGEVAVSFDERPIWENFSSDVQAEKLLIACGLRTIPAWKRPYHQLSNGEQHRAHIALCLDLGIYAIDEFTSVVDRDTAHSLCVAMSKWYKRGGVHRLVLATCHRDVTEWLEPDLVYDTDHRQWLPRGCLQRPAITLEVRPCDGASVWHIFRKHHYLSGKLNTSCNSWVATLGGRPIAFTSIVAFPNGNFKNAWRGHRTVVLPEFQGLGIGNRLSECIASMVTNEGGRFFSKTSHPAMGEHRNRSPLWKPTSKNRKSRGDYLRTQTKTITKEDGHKRRHAHRMCYSHEFIGPNGITTRKASP